MTYLRYSFAQNGDRSVLPVDAQANNSASLEEGYTAEYSLDPAINPGAQIIQRDEFNGILFALSQEIRRLQQQATPDFITAAENGGVAFAYDQNAFVRLGGVVYRSLVSSNTDTPPSANWADVNATGTETLAGPLEIATQTETNTGTDDTRAITPLKLAGRTATTTRAGVASIATQTEVNAGTDNDKIVTSLTLEGRTATDDRAGIIETATDAETIAGTDDSTAVTPAGLQAKLDTEIFTPFLTVTSVTHTFTVENGWQTVLVDAARANEWVWIVFDMPESTSNTTVYYRNGAQTHGQLPEYVCGRVTSNSIGTLCSLPIQLNATGRVSLNSDRNSITIRLTMLGQWGL